MAMGMMGHFAFVAILDVYKRQIPETARALQDFVDDMSNWYVRRSRERFWAKGMEQDKICLLYTSRCV